MPVTVVLSGFIPTRAGKMLMGAIHKLTVTVHPHSRGENPVIFFSASMLVGSSPLARGK